MIRVSQRLLRLPEHIREYVVTTYIRYAVVKSWATKISKKVFTKLLEEVCPRYTCGF